MWISRREFNRLQERVRDLERQVGDNLGYMPSGVSMGRLIRLVMEHLGVYYESHPPRDELRKKGGPERG